MFGSYSQRDKESVMNIKRICIALIMALLLCTLGAWVRPGPESAGLSFTVM